MSGFCTSCGWKVTSFDGLKTCPQCGSKGVPCDDANQVTVSINWHELSLLCIWAERWAIEAVEPSGSGGRGTVYAIADRLRVQHPDKWPLTLGGQINQLRDKGYDVKTNIPGEER